MKPDSIQVYVVYRSEGEMIEDIRSFSGLLDALDFHITMRQSSSNPHERWVLVTIPLDAIIPATEDAPNASTFKKEYECKIREYIREVEKERKECTEMGVEK